MFAGICGNNVNVISKWCTNHFGIFIQLVFMFSSVIRYCSSGLNKHTNIVGGKGSHYIHKRFYNITVVLVVV